MQSLKAKFNGTASEVLQYARDFDIFRAMRHYGVKDYIAMLHFLEEMAPGEHFQGAEVNDDAFSRPDAFDKLLDAMLRRAHADEATIKNQAAQIAELKLEVEALRANRWRNVRPKVQAILSEVYDAK